jgi:hypothetical protein
MMDEVTKLHETIRKLERERQLLRTAAVCAADLLFIVAPLAPLPDQCQRIAQMCLDAAGVGK